MLASAASAIVFVVLILRNEFRHERALRNMQILEERGRQARNDNIETLQRSSERLRSLDSSTDTPTTQEPVWSANSQEKKGRGAG